MEEQNLQIDNCEEKDLSDVKQEEQNVLEETSEEKEEKHYNTLEAINPVAEKQRFLVLDVLRGIAIFGILLMNIQDFAFIHGTRNFLLGKEYFPELINKIVILGSDFIARNKFVDMFSFLFGVGMAILLEKCIAKNVQFPKFFARRMAFLFLIGIVHGFLIWDGDILMAYAIVGFFLIAFDKAKPKTILICAICFKMVLVLPMVLGFPLMFTFKADLHDPVKVEKNYNEKVEKTKKSIEKNNKLFGEGSFFEIHVERIKTAAGRTIAVIGYGWDIIAMYLFGLWAWKKKIFQEVKKNKDFLIKVCRTSFVVGLIMNITVVFAKVYSSVNYPELPYIGYLGENIAGIAFCFFYISGITLLMEKKFFQKILHPFSYVGRAALSNYVIHSIVFTLVFYSYGFGIFGKTSPFEALIMAISVYILQISLSRLWFKKFKFGPLEWIWRSLTYGKRQPMLTSD